VAGRARLIRQRDQCIHINHLETEFMNVGEMIGTPLAVQEYTAAVEAACKRIAPLWPLSSFVAVNPFWGLIDEPFHVAQARMRGAAHADLHMDVAFYRAAWERGEITDEDLLAASRAIAGGRHSLNRLRDALLAPHAGTPQARILSVADFLDARDGGERAATVTDEISKWCARRFDHGQAAVPAPYAELPLFAAWRRWAMIDRNPELRGIAGLRALAAELSDTPQEVIAEVLEELGVGPAAAERFLHRQLMSIAGWAAHVSRHVFEDALQGRANDSLVHLLAVRLVFDLALSRELPDGLVREHGWSEVLVRCEQAEQPVDDVMAVWQEAFEIGFQRRALGTLQAAFATSGHARTAAARGARKQVQAVFCIDVRSEVYRRAFEAAHGSVETIGFAGFFGFPLRYLPMDASTGPALCPVLLTPALKVRETPGDGSPAALQRARTARARSAARSSVWKTFKRTALTSFAYVETCGLGFAARLIADAFGWRAARAGGSASADCPLPELPAGADAVASLAAMAAGALRNMGLTRDFARIVMLCGHGSSTENNPYGSALDCGACGGHAGSTNARVAARTLNDPRVRTALRGEGIDIPDDTLFIAAKHDTTTDNVEFLDCAPEQIPASHADDLRDLRAALDQASALTRTRRAPSLGLQPERPGTDAAVLRRSRDWAEVRPEWGLAGNALFIAAPRARTAGIALDGRAFLHNYDCSADHDHAVLELIMSAPMVVANWINMQYYASTIDNQRFGSGNKVTHDVVGIHGVLQGNGGDLQTGLPWQSVHDGTRFMHEPLRLNVLIEAPVEAIEAVIARNDTVRALVANSWVHLWAITPGGAGLTVVSGARAGAGVRRA